jgi:hypothetical protein
MSSQVSKPNSLEEILETVGNPVELLRNSQIGPYAFPVVRQEFKFYLCAPRRFTRYSGTRLLLRRIHEHI